MISVGFVANSSTDIQKMWRIAQNNESGTPVVSFFEGERRRVEFNLHGSAEEIKNRFARHNYYLVHESDLPDDLLISTLDF